MSIRLKWSIRGFLLVVLAYLLVATQLEKHRVIETATQPLAASNLDVSVDRSRLLADAQHLSDPSLEGRLTGTLGSHKAQEYIAHRFEEIGLRTFADGYRQRFSFVRHSLKGLLLPSRPFKQAYPDATNLIGYLPGETYRDSWIVLSAHYDHLGVKNGKLHPGADDNASGVAAILATATYFSQHQPEHSLLVAAFDAEEKGLRGSYAFFDDPPVKPEQIALEINLDMVSRNDENQIYVCGTYQSPTLKALVEPLASRSSVQVLWGHDRPMWRAGLVENWVNLSDHGPFHDHGIPFLYFGVADHEDMHEPGDTFERLQPDFFVETTRLILHTAMECDRAAAFR
ncbi:MAG: M28 family peptidase [Acidobacteria bacterium]|nr:M28 family peptidase [Acidobacteriota bacterium]